MLASSVLVSPRTRRPVTRVLLGLAFLLAVTANAWAEGFGLGDRPPTPAEAAYIAAAYTDVAQVEPNALARARVSAELGPRAAAAQLETALPTAVDNSTATAFPPIRSQGTQGSCTCWAAAYYYDTYTQAVDEGYDVSTGDNNHICSPAFLYPLINGGADNGANTAYAVARLNDIGACSWTLKPYSQSDWTSWPSGAAWVNALWNRTQSAYTISGSSASGLTAIKQHLANGNLAVTSFSVYSTWYYNYPASSTGINNGVYYYPDGSFVGGHAVTLVGYDDNKSYVDHRDGQTHYGAFLVANSWGSGWGVANTVGKVGFFWVAYNMFLEGTFGPSVYYNTDRVHYHPSLYAVAGINHAKRGKVALWGGVGPSWESAYAIDLDGGTALAVTDADPVAVDLTDGVATLTSTPPSTASVYLYVVPGAGSNGTITSADFYEDFDGDGTYTVHHSSDPTVTVTPNHQGSASAVLHDLTLTVDAPSPATVGAGGSADLSASYTDSEGHSVAWAWSDGGAGGSFAPSAAVQNPTYTAAAGGSTTYTVTLTATVTCEGPLPLTTQASTSLTVQPGVHSLTVTANPPNPTAVASGGTTSLSATFTDSDSGHSIASWSWSDGGAGGSFTPSSLMQSPSYIAPVNLTDSDRTVTLTVTGTCNGTTPLTDSDSTSLIVHPVAHALTVQASAAPMTIASGGTCALTGSALDTRTGHSIATWSWSDGGAGGSFSPSSRIASPTYTAAANLTDSDRAVTLTLTATCNGPSPLTSSGSTTVTVTPVAHSFQVGAAAVPATVASGGTTKLTATFTDSRSGHTVASWSWSDGGAGGVFSPSAAIASPTYTAPANVGDSNQTITLSVTGTCSGSPPLSDTKSVSLTVQPVAHALTVHATAPPTVVSGGTCALTGSAVDSRAGHAIASWAWSDGGAGGSFSPSANVQSPGYTAPVNYSDSDLSVTLTLSATCGGPSPLTASGTATVLVQPVAHALTVTASGSPSVIASAGTVTLTATAADSRAHALAWSWSDGGAGGSFSPSPNAQSPSYLAPANLTGHDLSIALTVTATCSGPTPLQAQQQVAVTVRPPVTAAFAATPDAGVLPLSVTFTDASTGQPTAWQWDFGDGAASAEESPNHEYRKAGRYAVTLTASSDVASNSATKERCVTATFTDVPITPPAAQWAAAEILACATRSIVQGYADFSYHPGEPVARDQMAVYLARALAGGDAAVPTGPEAPTFADVPVSYWAAKQIEYCVATGIATGYPDGLYHPDRGVDRGQMAVYISRAIATPTGDAGVAAYTPPASPSFSDVGTDFWAYRYIEYAHAEGVVNGFADGTYRPDLAVTRDQMAVYIARAFELPL